MRIVFFVLFAVLAFAAAQNCGCASNECCSKYGYCGTTADYCDQSKGCQKNCWGQTSLPSSSTPNPTAVNPKNRKWIGYWADWLQWGANGCQSLPENIPATRYTHINYAFVSFDQNNGNPSNPDKNLVDRLMKLKQKNPSLKIMASVGGGSFGAEPWTKLTSNPTAMNNYINKVGPWCRSYGFDGVDIDWEFPRDSDKQNFINFFAGLRKAFNAEATGDKRLLLTTASPAGEWALGAFQPEKLQNYVDWFNVMLYDFYGSWSGSTGPLTALYGTQKLDCDSAMKAYLNRGVSKSKLVFGIANYATTWTVDNQNGMYKPAHSGGNAGRCSNSRGYLSSKEVEELVASGAPVSWDDVSKTPYIAQGKNFVSFDNSRSIDLKMDYVINNGYPGAMMWVLDNSTKIADQCWKRLRG